MVTAFVILALCGLLGLRALVARGFLFQPVTDGRGHVSVLIGAYGWPGCDDRLYLHGENDAVAARAVPAARGGSDDVVWSYQGDALSTVHALVELPAPHEPGAPWLARRAPSGLWLPDGVRGSFELVTRTARSRCARP